MTTLRILPTALGMILLLALLLGAASSGCLWARDPFAHISSVESDLIRGVSTKAKVLELLGVPSGAGGAVLPSDGRLHEIWYYGDISVKDTRFEEGWVLSADAEMRVLMIFFSEDRFDSFLWYGAATEGVESK